MVVLIVGDAPVDLFPVHGVGQTLIVFSRGNTLFNSDHFNGIDLFVQFHLEIVDLFLFGFNKSLPFPEIIKNLIINFFILCLLLDKELPLQIQLFILIPNILSRLCQGQLIIDQLGS